MMPDDGAIRRPLSAKSGFNIQWMTIKMLVIERMLAGDRSVADLTADRSKSQQA